MLISMRGSYIDQIAFMYDNKCMCKGGGRGKENKPIC